MTSIIITEIGDVERLLRVLYHGSRPPGVHLLNCNCGRSANLTDGDAAWLGWQVLPHAMCPDCVAPEPYEGAARERFLELVNELTRKEG